MTDPDTAFWTLPVPVIDENIRETPDGIKLIPLLDVFVIRTKKGKDRKTTLPNSVWTSLRQEDTDIYMAHYDDDGEIKALVRRKLPLIHFCIRSRRFHSAMRNF